MVEPSDPAEQGPRGWRNWFFGLLLCAVLIGAVLHWGEIRQFAALVQQAEPGWLVVAILFQLSTYASVAAGWATVLRGAGTPMPLAKLMRIAVTKLFADQALPSAGMGGNVLLVDQLRRLDVPRGTAVAALLLRILTLWLPLVPGMVRIRSATKPLPRPARPPSAAQHHDRPRRPHRSPAEVPPHD